MFLSFDIYNYYVFMTFEDNDFHGGLNIDFTLSKCAIEQSCGQQYVLNLVNGSLFK